MYSDGQLVEFPYAGTYFKGIVIKSSKGFYTILCVKDLVKRIVYESELRVQE